MRKKLFLELFVFILFFCIIGFFLLRSPFLFFDDIIFGFQAVTKDYLNFYKNYINNYGFFRPLALVYYFFIYNIHLFFPKLVHLVPLTMLLITSILIFKILFLQGLNKKLSLSLSLLFLTIPLVTEGYVWLSANISIFLSRSKPVTSK